jgi:SIR2-like domain
MHFLKRLFDDELDADGDVIVAGTPFQRSRILAGLEPNDYEDAFSDWWEQRQDRLLQRADELLALFDNRERFDRLKAAFRTGSVIPLVGAGLSMPSGYPGWTPFLRKLCNESSILKADFETLLAQGEYEEAAQRLFDDSRKLFNEGLVNHFAGNRNIWGPVQYLPFVFDGTEFTTNFDNVLKRLFDREGKSFDMEMFGDDSEEFVELLGRGKRVLVRLHGHCDLVKHRVITKVEYDTAYDSERLEHLIRDVVFRKSLLFMGCSLVHDRLQKAMAAFVTSGTVKDLVSHFAIAELKDSDDRAARRKVLAEANIFPIWYPQDQHDEAMEALMLKLAEGVVEL